MAIYRYLASENGDPPHEVLMEAENPVEALGKLRSRGLTPVRALGLGTREGDRAFALRRSGIDVYGFTRQLAPLLSAYIPLEKALSIIAESAKKEEQRNFVLSLRQGLHEGKKFSELVRSHGSLFPGYYANLIESGEETGSLPESVRHLFQFMTESRDLRSFLISSSIYPCAILCVTLLVTILMFTVFVPRFARIFEDMGRTLPPSMEFLLAAGAFFRWLPLLILAAWLAHRLIRHVMGPDAYRFHVSRLLLSVPVLGRIISDLEMCRWIRTLSIMLSNHVEIIRSVRIAEKILYNPVICRAFQGIAERIRGGEKLSAVLRNNIFLPAEMTPMLRVGEESGSVGEMLTRIADNLEADTRQKIKRLLSLFEPAVIVLLAAAVLTVVVSIFMAMMDLNSVNAQGGPGL